MLKVVRLFFGTREVNPYLVVLCTLLASIAEAVGIGTLLPVIGIASGAGSSSGSPLASAIAGLLNWIGLDASLGTLVIIVAVFMILKALLSFAAIAYATIAASRVSISLRRDLLAAILKARWSYFSEQKSGKIANIIGMEASNAADAFIVSANVVSLAIQAVAYVAIAVAINPVLAAVALLVGAGITLALGEFVRIARKAGYKQVDLTILLMNYVVDMFANIKPLKTMHRQEPMLDTISKVFRKLQQNLVRRELAKAGLARAGDVMTAVIAAIGIYVASVLLKVPFSELLVSAIVFNQIVSVSTRLQRMFQQASALEAAFVRTKEVIAEAEAEEEVSAGTISPDAGSLSCRMENVSFFHGERRILNDVTVEFPANAIIVLSGPSGSGKTTIVDLLIGLHKPAQGQVVIGSEPIDKIDIRAWRQQIGYVPQELSLFHDSVRTNLTLGEQTISDAAIFAALDQAGASQFVAALPQGLDTDVGEMGSKLSGGQRQRISLACALVGSPRVLILDEVTSALDPETEADIIDNIAGLRGRYTVIAITHRPAWTEVADRLYEVSEGRVTLAASKRRTPRECA